MTGLSLTDHVVILGAGLAGWRTCEELRRHGFEGRLTLIGDESEAPYDRPPLSKQVLAGKWPLEHTLLATPEKLKHARVDLRTGVGARHLDVVSTSVILDDGSVVEGTHVVIATGARARRLAWYEPNIFELRNQVDERRLIARLDDLSSGDVVAIVGGGFIGAEVATAVKARGLHPIVLEAAQRPLIGVLGETVSQWLEELPSNFGVELRTNQKLAGAAYRYNRDVNGDADVISLDGSAFRARAVVMGVGAEPNVEWLSDSRLEIDNGVVVDSNQLCNERVGAVGDVASFPWSDGSHVRIEHWQVATEHAGALARHWMTGEQSPTLIPYFWSEQYGKKIQLLGHPRPDDEVERVKDTGEGQWLGVYSRAGVVTGLVALNQPRALMLSKPLLEQLTSLDDALEKAPWAP
jgi:3-phenylpropionate/trans-cinnamate dioxygenase ferredoxin reductase subunit